MSFSKNDGLVIAEIELPNVDQSIELPDWIGRAVKGEAPYHSSGLAQRPFRTWPDVSGAITSPEAQSYNRCAGARPGRNHRNSPDSPSGLSNVR